MKPIGDAGPNDVKDDIRMFIYEVDEVALVTSLVVGVIKGRQKLFLVKTTRLREWIKAGSAADGFLSAF